MAQNQVALGKRWLETAFDRIRYEFKDRVVIEHWVWQDNDPDYRFCFQITGQEALASLAFTRGTLTTCGSSNPTHHPVRERVEASIRHRFCALLRS
jgi:hypothetical protein